MLAHFWTKRAQSHRTRREAAQNSMASFAGDDYALERRKLRELQASVSRSTNRPPSVPRKKAPTPTSDGTAAAAAAAKRFSDGTAAAAAAAKRLRAALKVAGMRRAAELEVLGLLDALEAAHARCADEAASNAAAERAVLEESLTAAREDAAAARADAAEAVSRALEAERSRSAGAVACVDARGAECVAAAACAAAAIREELKTTRRAMRRESDARRDADAAWSCAEANLEKARQECADAEMRRKESEQNAQASRDAAGDAAAAGEAARRAERERDAAVAARNAARGELAAAQRVRKADRAAHEAEKNSWKARTEAEMDALDGKIRRLLRTRDAEIASLRDALSAARGERDRARGYLEELGNELPVSGRVAAAAGDCY